MNPKKSQNRPLPFPEWIEQTYPEKNAKRSFLKMIGALDLAYLMYRMGKKDEPMKTEKPNVMIPAMPLVVEDYQKPEPKNEPTKAPVKSTKQSKKTKKPVHAKKQPSTAANRKKEPQLTLELTNEPEPVMPSKEPDITPAVEPEPLELETEQIIEKPAHGKKTAKNDQWLNDESLEEVDLRKSGQELKNASTTLSFDVRDIDDEEETQVIVNGTAWRIMLPSPSMNLSRMAQIIRVSYGELYILGRAALGAMSGEGYVSADEVARIADALAAADKQTMELDVQYHDKDATSKKRIAATIRIRFEKA